MGLQKNKTNYQIAIVSRTKSGLTETFIRAHKDYIKNSIYYYDGHIPKNSEKEGRLIKDGNLVKLLSKVLEHYVNPALSINAIAFYRSLKRNNVDIVLAEYGVVGADLLPIVKRLNIKLIVHFHGFDASVNRVLNEYNERYIDMFDYASYIIVVSNVMKDKILQLGCPEEKIILNPCGPSDDFQRLEPSYKNNLFFAVGRFVEKKAPYYTILAFSKVLKKYKNAKLVMAGEGSLLSICKNLVRALKIENNVFFLGPVNHEQVKKYMQNSLAFVQHSITAENGDMEGCPVGILEASASGLPVVSTYHAGISDVIIHNKTGFLVEEHDVDAMAEYMLKIIGDKKLACRMGQEGKKYIRNNYSMSTHINKINEIIKECLNG